MGVSISIYLDTFRYKFFEVNALLVGGNTVGKMRAKKWTNHETEILLRLLETNFEPLWNLQHPDYCNRPVTSNLRSRLMTDLNNEGKFRVQTTFRRNTCLNNTIMLLRVKKTCISLDVHRSLESIMAQIKSIRDTVTRIIRIRTKGGTGSAGGGKLNIPIWYCRATFMEESVLAREAEETMVSVILSSAKKFYPR